MAEEPRPGPGALAGAPGQIAGIVLAAGEGTRFGGGKVRAPLEGRPLVAHVLAAARAAGIGRLVLVLGRDAAAVRETLVGADPGALAGVLIAVNPAPERGLATSLRLGLAATTAAPAPRGVLVLLADQPRVRADVIQALVDASGSAPPGALAVVPAYANSAAPNPVLALPAAWLLVAGLQGDRGLGPLLAARPELVVRVPATGDNPDVDTPADLAALEGSHP
jgi:CTP:molybdopterin cytidylyltransferase MocA